MHWIIQENLYREDGFATLMETMIRFNIPHTVVKVVPFSADLSDDQQTIPPVAPTGPVMVCGSTTLAKIAQKRGWTPGSFQNANHDYQIWRKHYGSDLLNPEAVVSRFADVEKRWARMFIRPCADTKTFSGTVMDWAEFVAWQHKVIALKETYTSLDADTLVCYGPVKTIRKEFRFFIVDNQIVGQSVYKIGSRVVSGPVADDAAVAFTRTMIERWEPARAYALDVALTDEGMKVIEINCINSAGFYAIDVAKFVMAIEDMEALA